MPLFNALQIPPPANWQDFETLCCDLWRRIWNDPNTQKNGRQGQPQHGVDIYGRPGEGHEWAGVQYMGVSHLHSGVFFCVPGVFFYTCTKPGKFTRHGDMGTSVSSCRR